LVGGKNLKQLIKDLKALKYLLKKHPKFAEQIIFELIFSPQAFRDRYEEELKFQENLAAGWKKHQ